MSDSPDEQQVRCRSSEQFGGLGEMSNLTGLGRSAAVKHVDSWKDIDENSVSVTVMRGGTSNSCVFFVSLVRHE
jgi:hypothetical protein